MASATRNNIHTSQQKSGASVNSSSSSVHPSRVANAQSNSLKSRTSWHGLARYHGDEEISQSGINNGSNGDRIETTDLRPANDGASEKPPDPAKNAAEKVHKETPDEGHQREYAKVDTVLDALQMDLTYYADVPGKVPTCPVPGVRPDDILLGNGDMAPEWGIDIKLHSASIAYGPWADRQRAAMQKFFFPSSYRNNEITPSVNPGDDRIHVALKILIVFEKEATVKLPLREASKDWKWTPAVEKNQSRQNESNKRSRPYGWMDIKASSGSVIKYNVPMVFDTKGCESALDVRFDQFIIVTSTNYDILLLGSQLKLQGSLPTPLLWNAPRKWLFDISLFDPKIFLLRDHITLMQDLLSDWTSAPNSSEHDMRYFSPMDYTYKIHMHNMRLYLCVNEHNIINQPTDLDDNAFIILGTPTFEATIETPFHNYKPETTCISFTITGFKANISLSLPKSNTVGEFLTESSREFCSMDAITAAGSYTYYSSLEANHLESMSLDLQGDNVRVNLFGFFIRYLLILRDNYVGGFVNFVTLDEYRSRLHSGTVKKNSEFKARNKPKPDPFEFYICLTVNEASILFPENLYSCERASILEFQELQVENRSVDTYQDMQVSFSPIKWTRDGTPSQEKHCHKSSLHNGCQDKNQFLYFEGVSIHAHRMFGPLPTASTYVCNWRIDVDGISGQVYPSAFIGLGAWISTFGYTMVDLENALPLDLVNALDPDVTFLNLSIYQIDLSVWGNGSVTEVSFKDGIHLSSNDLCNETYNMEMKLEVPDMLLRHLAMAAPTSNTALNSTFNDEHQWVEVARNESGVDITFRKSSTDRQSNCARQQAFLLYQDKETLRCTQLYGRISDPDTTRREHPVYTPEFFYPNCGGATMSEEVATSDKTPEVAAKLHGPSAAGNVDYFSEKIELLMDEDDQLPTASSRRSRARSSTSVYTNASDPSFVTASDLGSPRTPHRFGSYATVPRSKSFHEFDRDISALPEDTGSSQRSVNLEPSAKPRSIPYNSYLQRYCIVPSRLPIGSHLHSFVRPISNQFIPLQHKNTSSGVHRPRVSARTSLANRMNELFFTESGDEAADAVVETESITTLIVDPRRPFNLLVTPIFIKIAQEFLEELNPDDVNLETILDLAQMPYMEKITEKLTHKFRRMQLAFAMPDLKLALIQDMMLPADLLKSKTEEPELRTRYDLTDILLCTGDLSVQNLEIILSFQSEETPSTTEATPIESSLSRSAAKLTFDEIKGNLRFVSGSNSVGVFGIPETRCHWQRNHINVDGLTSEPVVLDAFLQGFSLDWKSAKKQNALDIELKELSFTFVSQFIEILAGAAYSWLAFVSDFRVIVEKFENQQRKQLQLLLAEISQFANDNPSLIGSDPVFLTRPSNIFRLGARNFQNDPGWRLLAHIRHCFRAMPRNNREILKAKMISTKILREDSNALRASVLRNFSTWQHLADNPTGSELDSCLLLRKIYSTAEAPNPTENHNGQQTDLEFVRSVLLTPENSVAIHLEKIAICLYEPHNENSLCIGPIVVNGKSTLYTASTLQQDESSHLFTSWCNSKRVKNTLNAEAGGNLGTLTININPYMLAFMKHLLEVQRAFSVAQAHSEFQIQSSKQSTPITSSFEENLRANLRKGPDSDKQEISDSNIPSLSFSEKILSEIDIMTHGVLILEQMNITATAHKLLMQVRMAAGRISTIQQFSSAPPPGDGLVESDRQSSKSKSTFSSLTNASPRLKQTVFGDIERLTVSVNERNSQAFAMLGKFQFERMKINASVGRVTKPTKIITVDSEKETIHSMAIVNTITVQFPQSLLKLYTFMEDWRTDNLPNYDFLFAQVINEWGQRTQSQQILSRHGSSSFSPASSEPRLMKLMSRDIRFQFMLHQLVFQSDILPSLQLRYDAIDLFADLFKSSATTPDDSAMSFSIQLKQQDIRFSQRALKRKDIDAAKALHEKSANFTIPAIRLNGKIAREESNPSNEGSETLIQQEKQRKRSRLEALLTLDFVNASLNAHMLDQLLTTHAVLSTEIGDVLDVFSFTNNRRRESRLAKNALERNSDANPPQLPAADRLQYTIRVCLQGLSVAAVSPAATANFESDLLHGSVISSVNSTDDSRSDLLWALSAKRFSLSLRHTARLMDGGQLREKERKRRLAYILMELTVRNYDKLDPEPGPSTIKNPAPPSRGSKNQSLSTQIDSIIVFVHRIHTVMQPAAVGKLADMYVHFNKELRRRKKSRALDINNLTANTKRILRSLNVTIPKYQPSTKPLLSDKRLALQINGLVIAIPLEASENISSAVPLSPESQQFSDAVGNGAALILFANYVEFSTRKWEFTSAMGLDFGIQFVSDFDQTSYKCFLPEFRESQRKNRLLLPKITCLVNSTSKDNKKLLWMDANVPGGFQMDVQSSIVDHINMLLKIWENSKKSVDLLYGPSNEAAKTESKYSETLEADKRTFKQGSNATSPKSDTKHNGLADGFSLLEIEASFVFQRGTVRLYPRNHLVKKHTSEPVGPTMPTKPEGGGRPLLSRKTSLVPRLNIPPSNSANSDRVPEEIGIDLLTIPGLNLCCFYKTPIGSAVEKNNDPDSHKAHIELTIHPSENIFYPSLIPFIQELFAGLKVGVQNSSEKQQTENSTPSAQLGKNTQMPNIDVTLYLRLLRTKFDLSCQPASKVMCTLNWEEGNFLFSSSRGEEDENARAFSCTGGVIGFSGNIRHAFSPEDCVRGETKDILFNATMMSRRNALLNDDFLSVVLEVPTISGELNIRHLQDLLLFVTVWVGHSQPSTTQTSRVKTESMLVSSPYGDSTTGDLEKQGASQPQAIKPFSIYVTVRLSRMDLAFDLGQAIGKTAANIINLRVSSKYVPDVIREVITSVDTIDFASHGRLHGTAKAHNFETAIRSRLPINGEQPIEKLNSTTFGHIAIGRMLASLEYEYQKILVFDLDPVLAAVNDLWTGLSSKDPKLTVRFDLILKHVELILSIKTVPIFVGMVDRVLALIEEKRMTVKTVMNRGKIKMTGSDASSTQLLRNQMHKPRKMMTGNVMVGARTILTECVVKVSCELLSLMLFPRHFYDQDCVQSRFHKLKTSLHRNQSLSNMVDRQVLVALNGGGSISKCICKKIDINTEKSMTITQWFEHASSTNSKNILNFPGSKVRMCTNQQLPELIVDHQFVADFDGRVDVALNFGLLKYLQDLGALFEEQMQRNAGGAAAGDGQGAKSPLIPAERPILPRPPATGVKDEVYKSKRSNSASTEVLDVEIAEKSPSSNEDDESRPLPLSPLRTSAQNSPSEQEEIVFRAKKPVKFDPQLKVMGDATPPLEWIGLQRQRVPGIIHNIVTLNMEEIALFGLGLYTDNALMPKCLNLPTRSSISDTSSTQPLAPDQPHNA